nr:hypothetical protein [uncultured Desulfobacter sp.]
MDGATATLLGAILGATLTGPISYFYANKLSKREQFQRHASKFMNSVVQIFLTFYPSSTALVLYPDVKLQKNIGNLSDKIPELIQSYSEFYFFVQDKKKFEEAMLCLRGFCERHGDARIANELAGRGDEFDKKIEQFLSFAEVQDKTLCDNFLSFVLRITQCYKKIVSVIKGS